MEGVHSDLEDRPAGKLHSFVPLAILITSPGPLKLELGILNCVDDFVDKT